MQFSIVRTEEEIKNLVLDFARNDERIRAVLLNGSRANANTHKDKFLDFDIVYMVTHSESFISNHNWIDVFGKRIALQMPDQMVIGGKDPFAFHYLMLFEDHNRIDLTIFPVEKLKSFFRPESLTVVWLDKDKLFDDLPSASERDYITRQPTQKEFTDCCNEFWWVSTYVAKGVCRQQIIYAKQHLEVTVRPMFLKMIEWHFGIQTDFKVPFGEYGKNLGHYIPADLYKKILSTYPDSDPENIWQSLFAMTEIFSKLAAVVAKAFDFNYDLQEEENVKVYLKQVYADNKTQ